MKSERSPLDRIFFETQDGAALAMFFESKYEEYLQQTADIFKGTMTPAKQQQLEAIKLDMARQFSEHEPAFALFIAHPDAINMMDPHMVEWIQELGRLRLASGAVNRPRSKTRPRLAA